jgi:hypothetical protein
MFKKCHNCGRTFISRGVRDKLGTFCSMVCRNNVAHPGFCDACTAATIPIPSGSNITVNAIGNTFYGRSDSCKTCGSVVRTQWFCFLFIPIFPFGKFRVKYVAPHRYLSRMIRRESDWQAIATYYGIGAGPLRNARNSGPPLPWACP